MAPLDYDNLTDAQIDALAEQLAAEANGEVTVTDENGEYNQVGPDGTDCGEGYVYRGGLGGCVSDLFNDRTDQEVLDIYASLGDISPDAGFLDIGDIQGTKPPPVVEGPDGQMYLSNPKFTPNGWITEPDYSTPVYFFHQPIEAGDARGIYAEYSDDLQSATQQGYWRTEEEIRRFWEGKKTADNPGQLNMQTFREQHPNMSFETYMAFIKENSALHQQGYTLADNPEMFSAITSKYGVKTTFTNSDGDVYGWNGSNYTKTYKVDQSFDVGGLIISLAAGAMTGGLMSSGALGTFLKGLSGFQKAAVINGLSTAVQTGGDLKAIAGSVIGTYAGGQLGSLVDLGSAAANSALSSSIASAVEQGIVNGEIDFNTVLTSGLLGGATEIGKDFITSLVDGNNPFDFGGLLGEDTELYKTLNGYVDPTTGIVETGLLGDIRGAFDEFTTKYITGGEWWEATSGNYKSLEEVSPGQWIATNWDGTTVELSTADLIKQGFETGFFGGFEPTTGESLIWDWISESTDAIPDSWYDQLYEWMTNASSSSGGTYTTQGGTTVTTASGGDDGGTDTTSPDDFDCSSINRQQVAGATTGTECGPCIEGYEVNEFEQCVETIGGQNCPEGQYYNEVTLQCEDEISYTPGAPCNAANGEQGTYNDQGDCIVPDGGGDGVGDDTGDGTGDDDTSTTVTTETTDTGGDIDCTKPKPGGFGGIAWEYACRDTHCADGTEKVDAEGSNCPGYVPPSAPVAQCSDPDRATKDDGSCGELCKDGTVPDQHEEGLCGNPLTTQPTEECDNGATVESGCSECADGTLPEDYEGGKCPTGPTTGGGDDGGDADCTLVECESPRPEGEQGVLWDKCCTDVTTTTTSGGETDCTLVECESPRPEGEAGALWDECCKDVTTTTSGGSSGGGFGGGGGGGMLTGEPLDLGFDIAGDPTLLARTEFPITDFLAGIFTNSTGGRNV